MSKVGRECPWMEGGMRRISFKLGQTSSVIPGSQYILIIVGFHVDLEPWAMRFDQRKIVLKRFSPLDSPCLRSLRHGIRRRYLSLKHHMFGWTLAINCRSALSGSSGHHNCPYQNLWMVNFSLVYYYYLAQRKKRDKKSKATSSELNLEVSSQVIKTPFRIVFLDKARSTVKILSPPVLYQLLHLDGDFFLGYIAIQLNWFNLPHPHSVMTLSKKFNRTWTYMTLSFRKLGMASPERKARIRTAPSTSSCSNSTDSISCKKTGKISINHFSFLIANPCNKHAHLTFDGFHAPLAPW